MSKVHSYWSDEGDPAVLLNKQNEMIEGYTLPEQARTWQVVTEADVLEWFKAGTEMTKDSFEAKFGTIGSELPQLPQV
jgi:hypothetical protein